MPEPARITSRKPRPSSISPIEKDAGSHDWKPESLRALRSHQPTPRSLAEAEGSNGVDFTDALDSLDRARTANRNGDIAACSREIAHARAVLR